MIVRVIGVVPSQMNTYQPPQTRFYQPTTSKKKIENDFDLIFQNELKKLHINILI